MSIFSRSILPVVTLLLVASCTPAAKLPLSQNNVAGTVNQIAALSVADSCLVLIDKTTQAVVGSFSHSDFNRTSSIATFGDGNIYLALHAGSTGAFKALSVINLAKNQKVREISVASGPTLMAVSEGGLAVVSHNVEQANGQHAVSIVDLTQGITTHKLLLPGIVDDIAIKQNRAYVALSKISDETRRGIQEINLLTGAFGSFYALPQNPARMSFSTLQPDLLYVTLYPNTQFDETCPSSQRADVVAVNMSTKEIRRISQVSTPKAVLETALGNLIVSESCASTGSKLRLINPKTGDQIQENQIGVNPVELTAVSPGVALVTLYESSQFVFINAETLQELKRIDSPCRRPSVTVNLK